MAHDFHFLSRLSRVEGASLELALGLYRDPELVRWLLASLPLGDAEVVALPLLPGEAPPYALASRKGKFITCLGAGMVPDAAVATWPQLDQLTGQLQAWREVKRKGQNRVVDLERRIFQVGPWLAREDFEDMQVVGAVRPTLFGEVVRLFVTPFLELRVMYRPGMFDPWTSQGKDLLSRTWKAGWAASHASLVSTEVWLARRVLDPNINYDALIAAASLPALLGLDGTLVRSAWTISRLGAPAIDLLAARLDPGEAVTPEGERLWDESGAFLQHAFLYALLAIGVRLPDERARVREIVGRLVPAWARERVVGVKPDEIYQVLKGAGFSYFTWSLLLALTHLDEADQGFSTSLRAVFELARGFWVPSQQPDRVVEGPRRVRPRPAVPVPPTPVDEPLEARAARVPADMLYVPAFGLYSDLYSHSDLLPRRLHVMPRLADKTPSDMFFPQKRLDYLAKEYSMTTPMEHVRSLLNAQYLTEDRAQPVRVEAVPGRNEACRCGSGIKYKKCCGRGA